MKRNCDMKIANGVVRRYTQRSVSLLHPKLYAAQTTWNIINTEWEILAADEQGKQQLYKSMKDQREREVFILWIFVVMEST